jgi:hypothetical protein
LSNWNPPIRLIVSDPFYPRVNSMFFLIQSIAANGLKLWRELYGCTQGGPAGRRTAAAVFARLRAIAPYAAIELLLPGGSIIALTAWWLRRRRKLPTLAAKVS